jgi:pyruvyl transferase EpsI
MKRMIHNCKALSLYFREKKSYSKALELFDTSKIRICPDIVLYNNYQNENLRKDVLVCLRHDEESVMDDRDRQEILDCVFNLGRRVRMWDTCLAHGVSLAERVAVVEKGIREVPGYSLVVTDRLHCMIFCAITGTPCIALDNKNSKISSSYEWIKDLGFVSCVDDISLLESEAQRLMQIYPDGSPKRVDHELFRGLILDLTGH